MMGLTASGQQYYPGQDQQPNNYVQQEASEHSQVFDRVRDDLDRVHDGTQPFTAERTRIMRARQEVSQCQRTLAGGDYDRREFDDAINAIQRVADTNPMSDRRRNMLLDDVRDMRRLQSRLES
jgi:hypothetical protein